MLQHGKKAMSTQLPQPTVETTCRADHGDKLGCVVAGTTQPHTPETVRLHLLAAKALRDIFHSRFHHLDVGLVT